MRDDQATQILRAINNLSDDMKEFKKETKEEMASMKQDITSMKQDITSIKKDIATIYKEIDKINEKVDKHYKDMRSALDAYENSVENMYQDNRKRIIVLEKRQKVANA